MNFKFAGFETHMIFLDVKLFHVSNGQIVIFTKDNPGGRGLTLKASVDEKSISYSRKTSSALPDIVCQQ